MSCMAGGDEVALHNSLRDVVFDFCQRGRLSPEREAAGLLRGTSLPDGRRRPADVLICSSAVLPARLPDGSRQSSRRVALDFAVINAVGPAHWPTTLVENGDAAAAYADKKRAHLDTAARCAAAGIHFQPVVFTKQGCMASEAVGLLHGIAEAVASCEGLVGATVREQLLERIAVTTSRSTAQAILRRRGRRAATAEAASGRLQIAAALAMPEEM